MLAGESPTPGGASGEDPFHLSEARAGLEKGGRSAIAILTGLAPEVRAVVQHAVSCAKEENLRLLRVLVKNADGDPPTVHVQDWNRSDSGFTYAASRFSELTQAHLLANVQEGKGVYMVTQLGRYVAAWSDLTPRQIEKLDNSKVEDLYRP